MGHAIVLGTIVFDDRQIFNVSIPDAKEPPVGMEKIESNGNGIILARRGEALRETKQVAKRASGWMKASLQARDLPLQLL